MIGLCIGTGTWLPIAQRAAARMASMTGVECRVVNRVDSNLVHPSWHKLNLLRDYPGEDLFIFDADMWCMKPWDPTQWVKPGKAIAMAQDPGMVSVESILYHIPLGGYYNAGLMIVTPEAKEVFAATKKLHPRYGSYLEQTGLSHNIHSMHVPHTVMPWQYNVFSKVDRPFHTDAINVHFAGLKSLDAIDTLYRGLEKGREENQDGI